MKYIYRVEFQQYFSIFWNIQTIFEQKVNSVIDRIWNPRVLKIFPRYTLLWFGAASVKCPVYVYVVKGTVEKSDSPSALEGVACAQTRSLCTSF